MANNKRKSLLIAEIIGAVAAVILLCIQLFWSKGTEPELRQLIETISLTAVAVSAVLLVAKSRKKKKINNK